LILGDYVAAGIMSAVQAGALRQGAATRVVIIEDTRELQCVATNLVAMHTKDGVAFHRAGAPARGDAGAAEELIPKTDADPRETSPANGPKTVKALAPGAPNRDAPSGCRSVLRPTIFMPAGLTLVATCIYWSVHM
jgi:hypothetical protein